MNPALMAEANRLQDEDRRKREAEIQQRQQAAAPGAERETPTREEIIQHTPYHLRAMAEWLKNLDGVTWMDVELLKTAATCIEVLAVAPPPVSLTMELIEQVIEDSVDANDEMTGRGFLYELKAALSTPPVRGGK